MVLNVAHSLLAHSTTFQNDALVKNGLSSTCVGLGGKRKITMRQNKESAKEYGQTRAVAAKESPQRLSWARGRDTCGRSHPSAVFVLNSKGVHAKFHAS